MNRRNFIGALALAPLLVKEAIDVQKKNRLFAVGDYQPFKPIRLEGPIMNGPGWYQGESWVEFEVPFTKMNWKMDVRDFDDNSMTAFYKAFNKGVLPEFYKDPFRRSRRKNGLIKLGKAIR